MSILFSTHSSDHLTSILPQITKPRALTTLITWMDNRKAALHLLQSIGDAGTLQRILGKDSAVLLGEVGGRVSGPTAPVPAPQTVSGASTVALNATSRNPTQSALSNNPTLIGHAAPSATTGPDGRKRASLGDAPDGSQQPAPKKKRTSVAFDDDVIDLTSSPPK